MVDDTETFYVLKYKDNGKTRVIEINPNTTKWEPRADKSRKRKYKLNEPTYYNGVLFLDGFYLTPFWLMEVVDKTGGMIEQPNEPHDVTLRAFNAMIGDDLTAEDLDADDELPPMETLAFDDVDDADDTPQGPDNQPVPAVVGAAPYEVNHTSGYDTAEPKPSASSSIDGGDRTSYDSGSYGSDRGGSFGD